MTITSAISQLRTTDLAESIRFYTTVVGLTLEFQYEDFYAGIRAGHQVFHQDNQGHAVYFGEHR
jgi:catechol 2,3-dioxygenase-like lactoylglutathione lyase family enzyme